MIDRSGRIVFGSLLALVLILASSVVLEQQFGAGLQDYPLLAFLVFAGVALAGPQLYLAATDEDGPTRSRVQFAAIAVAVFATVFAGNAEGVRYLLIATIGACSVFGLVCYELLSWYQPPGEETAIWTR